MHLCSPWSACIWGEAGWWHIVLTQRPLFMLGLCLVVSILWVLTNSWCVSTLQPHVGSLLPCVSFSPALPDSGTGLLISLCFPFLELCTAELLSHSFHWLGVQLISVEYWIVVRVCSQHVWFICSLTYIVLLTMNKATVSTGFSAVQPIVHRTFLKGRLGVYQSLGEGSYMGISGTVHLRLKSESNW